MPPDLGQIYDEHAQALYAFALNLTRAEAEARDVLHEVFARIAARPQIIGDVQNTRHFLLRLTHRAAVDAYRRAETRERFHALAATEPTTLFAPAADPDAAAFRASLSAALAELPPDQRAVVHLKLWEDLTFADIAGALDIPLNTAASRYRYGIEKLRDHLRPLYRDLQSSTPAQI